MQSEHWKQHFIHPGPDGGESFSAIMKHAVEQMTGMFAQVQAPYSGLEPSKLEQLINQVDLDGHAPLEDIITKTVGQVAKHSIIVQHPSCIAHLHTPPLLASVAAEFIIGSLNQSMDSWDQASAATYVEQHVVDWTCKKFGLGAKSDGIITSGGTQSNQMGLLLARDWIADKISGHSVQKLGLPEYASKLRIVCSENAHFTVQKSASWMGLGEKAVLTVPAHENGTMDVTQIERILDDAKARGDIPFAIVGTAGTTDHGAIDDLDSIADMAKQHELWMHVDSAYGGALILSSHKARLTGIERAHSVSVDFHKLFYQTISCGALLVNDKANFKYLLHHADYLNREHDTLPNLVDKSMATTKRFDALKVYMTMQSVGAQELGRMFDHLIEQTQQVAQRIRENETFELLAQPCLSTVLFRVVKSSCSDLESLNQRVRVEALTRGVAVLGETIIAGKTALKFTILNPCLTMSDFDALLSQIEDLAAELG